MKIIIILMLIIFILPATSTARSQNTENQDLFEELHKNARLDNVEINTGNLAKCSAQYYALAVQLPEQPVRAINNIKFISEYLYMLAINRDKKSAIEIYKKEKQKYLHQINKKKQLDIPKSNQVLCANVVLNSKIEIEKYIHNSPQNMTNIDMRGIWVNYYAKWETFLTTREYAKNVEVVNFEQDGNATLAIGGLYKTSKSVIFDFMSPYVLARGRWSIKNNKIIADFKVIKNNSISYRKLPLDSNFKHTYSLVGERIFTGEQFLSKLNTIKYTFIDKLKLFSEATESEKNQADRILKVIEKDDEITRKVLRGGGAELSDEEKEFSNIDIDKEFFDFTEDEIKERDRILFHQE